MNARERRCTARARELGFDYSREQKETAASCNLCGATVWTVIAHRDRYGFPASTAACSTCGLTFLNPRMTSRGYGRFYRDIYRPLVSAYHGRRIDARSIQKEQLQYAAEVDTWSRPFLTSLQKPTLLDIGGSTGVMASHFARRYGARATVLDPSPHEIAEARALGVETIESLLEDWSPGRKKYHVVTMFQTIDHLLDVADALGKARRALRKDGIFIVDFVDFRYAFLKQGSVDGALKIDHPYSLTETTMEAFLARSGFSVAVKAYSADHHLVGYVCRPARPQPGALPGEPSVARFFAEVRKVHAR